MLSLLLLSALATPAAVTVTGEITDAVADGRHAWVAVTRGDERELLSTTGARVAVPREAVFAAPCGERVIFASARGLIDQKGAVVLAHKDALFRVPDPRAVRFADLCTRAGELILPTASGILFRGKLVQTRDRVKSYSGRRGARGTPYGAATSLYVPRVVEADVDGDGDLDVVFVAARSAVVVETGGRARTISVRHRGPGDLRLFVGKVGGPGTDEVAAKLVVTEMNGLVPTSTRAFSYALDFKARAKKVQLWKRDGFTAPLGFERAGIVRFFVDTSVMSMGAALVSGNLPLTVERSGRADIKLSIAVDLQRGLRGELPILCDLDEDGRAEVLDMSGDKVRVHGKDGARELAWSSNDIAMARALQGGVLLVGKARKGRAKLSVVR